MSTIINTSLTEIKPDDILRVIKVGSTKKPNFQMVGNGTMNRHGIQSICMIHVTANATSAGRFVISEIAKLYTYESSDGIVHVPMKIFTESQKRTWRKGFKELKEQELIVRVKREHYLLNPNMLVPTDYAKAIDIWNKATTKQEK